MFLDSTGGTEEDSGAAKASLADGATMGALFLLPLGRPLGFVGSGAGCRPEAQELVSIHANNSRSPAKAVFQRTDVRDWQHLERMVLVASKEFRGADIICPGAGVYLDLPGYAINRIY